MRIDYRKWVIFGFIFIALGAFLLFTTDPIVYAGMFVRKARQLYTFFENSIRERIAYFSAALLIPTAFVLFLRKSSWFESPELPVCELEEEKKSRAWMWFLGALVLLFLFWSPYLFKGQDTHIRIMDNLDCHVPQTKILAESGKAFSLSPDTRLDNLTNGLRLSGVDSGYNVMTWLFILFPPFTAYALNDLLVRLIAFFGMYLVLSRYFIPTREERLLPIIIGVSLCFSFIPFYPASGISVAGIPLLLYAFLNLLTHRWRFADYAIIVFFPFYSKLALAGFFIAVALFFIFLVHWIKRKKFHFPYFIGLVVLTLVYCFTHFHLLYSFLDPSFTSHREEIRPLGIDTWKAFKDSAWNFVFDRVNEVSAQHLFVMITIAFAAIVALFKKINSRARLMSGLVLICAGTAMLWGFKYWNGIIPLREKVQLLNAFDFGRFFWLNPPLWYFAFGLALFLIARAFCKKGRTLAMVLITGQILFMFMNYNWEYRYMLGIKSSYAGSANNFRLTWREFFSEPLFKEIADYIGKPKKDYRVVSLGIHPAIAQFNGFYTLDIYTDIYPLEYKKQFSAMIADELPRSEELRRGFDQNAKRLFLLAQDIHGDKIKRGKAFSCGITKYDKDITVNQLNFNVQAFKQMGGQYIFSAVPIMNYAQIGLSLEKVFGSKESPWRIFLYRAI